MKKQKNHYDWWSLVRSRVRKYPYPEICLSNLSDVDLAWGGAIGRAVSDTLLMPDGKNRMKVIRMVHWERTHTLDGAAKEIPCDRSTAARWQRKFFEDVARNRGLLD